MKRDDEVSWGRLGRIEKLFLGLMTIWALFFFTGFAQRFQTLIAVAAIVMGVVALIKIGRMAMRNLIWRLRNRLIVAYLFIAVVPIVLILALMLVTSYALVGQMAVYLVTKELDNRMSRLACPAETLTRAPARDPQTALTRALPMLRRGFPKFEILATGEQPFRYPPDSKLTPPPEPWKNASGLITKQDGDTEHLYAWAHAEQGGNEVTILAPITAELLSGLVEGIGDITFLRYTQRSAQSHVPPPANASGFRREFSVSDVCSVLGEPAGAAAEVVLRRGHTLLRGAGHRVRPEGRLERCGDDLPDDVDRHLPDRGDAVLMGRSQADASHHRRGARVVRRHHPCARGRFLLSHSGERRRSDRRTGGLVQHHDGESGPPDCGGQGKGAARIGTRDRARRAESAFPEGRSVHQDPSN